MYVKECSRNHACNELTPATLLPDCVDVDAVASACCYATACTTETQCLPLGLHCFEGSCVGTVPLHRQAAFRCGVCAHTGKLLPSLHVQNVPANRTAPLLTSPAASTTSVEVSCERVHDPPTAAVLTHSPPTSLHHRPRVPQWCMQESHRSVRGVPLRLVV